MMHLVTGHAGIEHIKPSDDGAFNAGVVGTGKYVFDLGNKFEYEIVSNNLVKIKDGELVNQGRHANIPVNNYEEVTIENGLQGVKRYDLICARYTKNADTSIESAELVVMKGTSSATPSDPACVEGNILEGALIDDFPLYRVRIDGLNIVGVDCLFEVIPSLVEVNAKAEQNAKIVQNIMDNLGISGNDVKQENLAVPHNTATSFVIHNATKNCIVNLGGWLSYPANSSGIRALNLFIDSQVVFADGKDAIANETSATNVGMSGIYKLSAGQKLTLRAYQTSGATLNATVNYGIKVIEL